MPPRHYRQSELDSLFQRAAKQQDEGNLRSAFRLFLAAAKGGDPSCQTNLGNFYGSGIGVYQRAYRQGRGCAASNIGNLYRREQNWTQALAWYERAAKLKDGDAELETAKIYLHQMKNRSKAIPYLKRAIRSKYILEESREEAQRLLDLSMPPRRYRQSELDCLFQRAAKQQEEGNLRSAFRLFLAGAKGGDSRCQTNLGTFYCHGIGVKPNRALALFWYRRAYRRGQCCAANNIGIVFRDEKNWKQALAWFERAAKLKDGDAELEIAKMYLHELKDRAKAIPHLKRAVRTVGSRQGGSPAPAEATMIGSFLL